MRKDGRHKEKYTPYFGLSISNRFEITRQLEVFPVYRQVISFIHIYEYITNFLIAIVFVSYDNFAWPAHHNVL